MTPQEKANELVDKFIQTNGNAFFAKECALIAVDECLVAVESDWGFMQRRIEFWQQVKQEIQKL